MARDLSEAGLLPHHMVGTHRRLKLVRVLTCRGRLDPQVNDALDAMTADAEDLGLHQLGPAGSPHGSAHGHAASSLS